MPATPTKSDNPCAGNDSVLDTTALYSPMSPMVWDLACHARKIRVQLPFGLQNISVAELESATGLAPEICRFESYLIYNIGDECQSEKIVSS